MVRCESGGGLVLVHAIDGTAGSGKGTVADNLREQNIPVLDTGQGYRAATEFWYQLQEENGLDRNDPEAVYRRLYPFHNPLSRSCAGENFASLLPANVHFGVDGVYIGGEMITEEQKSETLYDERISRIISTIAQLPSVRGFCRGISLQFIRDAVERGQDEVGIDGRTGRQEITRYAQEGDIDTRLARLALPAFFEVESHEAARRILARDSNYRYDDLSLEHEAVKQRAATVDKRNKRDSDPDATEPMGYTREYLHAWHDDPDAASADRVIGNKEDGSDARSVRFDTTHHSPEEVLSKYEEWRATINDRLRRPVGVFAVSYPAQPQPQQ